VTLTVLGSRVALALAFGCLVAGDLERAMYATTAMLALKVLA
jgi:hypothetical protein